ncbi:MAG: hypothetical protein H0T46_09875 [Deltaproteobacteria bacterium]|nr:hypothetical protein [Deltaproteobacteria bacterium]
MRRALLLAVLSTTGCASARHQTPGPVRFAVADPVRLVNDRKPVSQPPTFDEGLAEYYVKQELIAPTRRVLTIGDTPPAQNVNSLGEVPDSAWFTNHTLTPEQIERGPGADGPDRSTPWKVTGVKVGGASIGFTIKDARGDKYVLKFDEEGHPETETSADVIVQRLTWAFGYNVPENNVVSFKREDLVLDEEAEIKYRSGKREPMTEADLEKYLAMVEKDGDKLRGLASKMITGKIVGGVEPTGTRKGDPNDRVPHELRRDLRGQRVLWSWVNHIDLKSQNTLATYTDEKYVKWYAIDFGESLGVGARTDVVPRLGYRSTYSGKDVALNLVTFGLRVAPYERRTKFPDYRGLGHFEADSFVPADWISTYNWRPTDVADKFDELWGAEILMRLSRAHVEAAVRAAHYSDQRTEKYIVDTLLARQRKLGRHAFSRLAPLIAVTAQASAAGLELCFDDLWLLHAYGRAEGTTYRARSFDYAGKPIGTERTQRAAGVRTCVAGVPAAVDRDGYTIARVDVVRDRKATPPMFVHIAAGKVIGIDRR